MKARGMRLASVGNELMDEQHRRLIGAIECLQRLIEQPGNREKVEQGLVELYSLALKHFNDEELLLEIIAFPWLDDHRMAHHQFAGQIASLMARYRRSDIDFTRQALIGLHQWLLVHIKHDDMRYAPVLTGVVPSPEIPVAQADNLQH